MKISLYMLLLQENYPAVMKKNIKPSSEQQRERYLRALMSFVVHVLVLAILDLLILDFARLIVKFIAIDKGMTSFSAVVYMWFTQTFFPVYRSSLMSLLKRQSLNVLFP